MNAKENLLRAINHDHPLWVPNSMENSIQFFPPVVERPKTTGKDAFGVKWGIDSKAKGGTYPVHNGHTISDICNWREQITIPDIEQLDWSEIIEQVESIDRNEHLLSGFFEMGLFERSYLLLSMEEALIAYLAEPDHMNQMLAAIADYKIALIRKFNEVADLDLVWYGDDWGTQENLFVSPEIWRKIIKPHTQRIYNCIKECGAIVGQHSCGMIEPIFGDMVEMGAKIWNPCQPCNDLAGLKKRFSGQIAFCGGIDSQFVLDRAGVTPEEVRAEVRKRIDELADGGGYVASPSHSVPYDPIILEAMNDEISRYGKYS